MLRDGPMIDVHRVTLPAPRPSGFWQRYLPLPEQFDQRATRGQQEQRA